MQLFILSSDPVAAAQELSDVHVRVICREATMCLSSWYWWNVEACREELPYLPMNQNQPLVKQLSSIPVRRWAYEHAEAAFEEFTYRFQKTHASQEKFEKLRSVIEKYDNGIKIGDSAVRFVFVPKGQGVYWNKTMSQAVLLYRQYYQYKIKTMKARLVYTGRNFPDWLKFS